MVPLEQMDRAVPVLREGKLARLLSLIERMLAFVSAIAIVAAGLILCYSVAGRYVFGLSNDWQDELAVFLLVGATFLSAGQVQTRRGHIAISVLAGVLPPVLERLRLVLVDLVCLLFCAFFTNESWKFFLEAYEDGRVSDSAWAPPLWIPYSLMAAGMALLTLRLLVQLTDGISRLLRGAS
jgi:TRAP-type C4-dicarboxylate transport system permease small subunit